MNDPEWDSFGANGTEFRCTDRPGYRIWKPPYGLGWKVKTHWGHSGTDVRTLEEGKILVEALWVEWWDHAVEVLGTELSLCSAHQIPVPGCSACNVKPYKDSITDDDIREELKVVGRAIPVCESEDIDW